MPGGASMVMPERMFTAGTLEDWALVLDRPHSARRPICHPQPAWLQRHGSHTRRTSIDCCTNRTLLASIQRISNCHPGQWLMKRFIAKSKVDVLMVRSVHCVAPIRQISRIHQELTNERQGYGKRQGLQKAPVPTQRNACTSTRIFYLLA